MACFIFRWFGSDGTEDVLVFTHQNENITEESFRRSLCRSLTRVASGVAAGIGDAAAHRSLNVRELAVAMTKEDFICEIASDSIGIERSADVRDWFLEDDNNRTPHVVGNKAEEFSSLLRSALKKGSDRRGEVYTYRVLSETGDEYFDISVELRDGGIDISATSNRFIGINDLWFVENVGENSYAISHSRNLARLSDLLHQIEHPSSPTADSMVCAFAATLVRGFLRTTRRDPKNGRLIYRFGS